jgi:hypothetical protein
MSTPKTVRFLISIPSEDGSGTKQFLLNLSVAVEPASEDITLGQIEVAVLAESTTSDFESVTGPVSSSQGPHPEDPNPGGG